MKLVLLLFTFGMLAMLALRGIAVLRSARTGSEIDPNDPRFAEAERKARATLPDFLRRIASPPPGTSDYAVKFRLRGGSMPEQIWAEELVRQGGRLVGRLANDPRTPGYRIGQAVEIDENEILDWGFLEDGVMKGHYSTRIFLERMPPAMRDDVCRQFGW